jgi:hypothetical protein
MAGGLFSKWAVNKDTLPSAVGRPRSMPLAQAALDGSASAGALGWLEVKLVSAAAAGAESLMAHVWMEHRDSPRVQGPLRTCRARPGDGAGTIEWHQRFHFAWAAIDGKPPHELVIQLLDNQQSPTPTAEATSALVRVPISLGLGSDGDERLPPHVMFGDRAVCIHPSKGTARDEERWFPLQPLQGTQAAVGQGSDAQEPGDSRRRDSSNQDAGSRQGQVMLQLQLCLRLSTSIDLILPRPPQQPQHAEPTPEAATHAQGTARSDGRLAPGVVATGGDVLSSQASSSLTGAAPTEGGKDLRGVTNVGGGGTGQDGGAGGASGGDAMGSHAQGATGKLLQLVQAGKGASAAYRILAPCSSSQAASAKWHPPLAWKPSIYTQRDVQVLEVPRNDLISTSQRLPGAVFLYARLREILSDAAERRSRRVLKAAARSDASISHPLVRPTLFLSSTHERARASAPVRAGALDQIGVRWHQDFWHLKDPGAKSKWHPPLVW